MKNEFEEMYDKDEFNNDFENEIENETIEPTTKTNSDKIEDEEVTYDDYVLEEYIKTPDVDESVTFVVDKILNVKDPKKHRAVNKTNGEEFVVGVKRKDGLTIRKDIITDEGKRFVLNSWALYYLFMSNKGKFAETVRKNGSIKGIKIKLTRKYDGSVPNEKVKKVMQLYNFKTEEEAINYQKEVATAMKEGRLFELEILD